MKYMKDLPHIYEDLQQKHNELRTYLLKLQDTVKAKDKEIELSRKKNLTGVFSMSFGPRPTLSMARKSVKVVITHPLSQYLLYCLKSRSIKYDQISLLFQQFNSKITSFQLKGTICTLSLLIEWLRSKPFRLNDMDEISSLAQILIEGEEADIELLIQNLKNLVKVYDIQPKSNYDYHALAIMIIKNKRKIFQHCQDKCDERGINK